MLIGKVFNKKCEEILSEGAEISEYKSGYKIKISVEDLNKSLGFGRKEIRYYFEYMKDQNLIDLTTIGEPFYTATLNLRIRELQR